MQIICLQEKLKQSLNITERIIGRNLTLPILNNILINVENNKLKISSTNLEIGINYWLTGKVIQGGSITVPARLISDLISNLPNKKIELKVKNNLLELKCDKFKAVLNGLSANDFPIIPKIKEKPIIKINGAILRNSLAQVVEMVSSSESRPEISGVYMKFDKNLIKLAATDSFRLAEKNIEIKNNQSLRGQTVIIPQRTIQEIIRILSDKESEVEIVLSTGQILFNMEDVQVISRLIEGKYPDYQQIIPSDFKTEAITNREELINNVKLASLFSGKINNVKLAVNPQKSILEITAKDIDIGENNSQIETKIIGNAIEVVFNYRYLLDGLNNIFSDKVILGFNTKTNPIVLKPIGDNSYTYLVMPINA
ncbi:MAG: DNA polymerase III subunit beta [Candidatus Portnoybacteria bacterium CG23_combo_of_CG06-09_8_20_14_all_37_13]|uniref:Beta sliding clamp n=1 Tax=Candidatus Portnoybacteria bacterium CG23_combo_of_CG06-09_8_20_14_all_37_13 TaxID=1974819 RepID=A0A2G9YDJ9_9BACT|nr:MAG: DNA polymerase III subunit beta [Candidatus Portnoybacteria bacterium CG23_combo_of_CG06-09_8_20_14_all_37_13]